MRQKKDRRHGSALTTASVTCFQSESLISAADHPPKEGTLGTLLAGTFLSTGVHPAKLLEHMKAPRSAGFSLS